MDLNILLEKLNTVLNDSNTKILTEAEDKQDSEEETQIKPTMGFERLMKFLFNEEDQKMGRIALRKILNGNQDKLTLRERGVVANALIKLIPIIANDRTIFNRMEKKMAE